MNILSKIMFLSRSDPTRTLTLRKKFSDDITRRFRRVKKNTKAWVVNADCFGTLESQRNPIAAFASMNIFPSLYEYGGAYRGLPIDKQLDRFMSWFDNQIVMAFYPEKNYPVLRTTQALDWDEQYIERAYLRGISWARAQIKKDKDLMLSINESERSMTDSLDPSGRVSPSALVAYYETHSEALASLQLRERNDLEGITDATYSQVSRVTSDALLAGAAGIVIYDAIADRISKIGEHRGNLLGRSEIIRAHHVASILEYERYGIYQVRINAEWVTAGDSRVCPDCKSMEGKIFTTKEIIGLIPLHPLCRCAAIPTLEETTYKK